MFLGERRGINVWFCKNSSNSIVDFIYEDILKIWRPSDKKTIFKSLKRQKCRKWHNDATLSITKMGPFNRSEMEGSTMQKNWNNLTNNLKNEFWEDHNDFKWDLKENPFLWKEIQMVCTL